MVLPIFVCLLLPKAAAPRLRLRSAYLVWTTSGSCCTIHSFLPGYSSISMERVSFLCASFTESGVDVSCIFLYLVAYSAFGNFCLWPNIFEVFTTCHAIAGNSRGTFPYFDSVARFLASLLSFWNMLSACYSRLSTMSLHE